MNETKFLEDLIEYEEYYLIKDNKAYKIMIEKRKEEIIFKCKNYEAIINKYNLSILTKSMIHIFDNAYEIFVNLFEQNKVYIKSIIANKSIRLSLKISVRNRQKEFDILLIYNKQNNFKILNELINNYTDLKYNINYLKSQINLIKTELNKIKKLNSSPRENQITKMIEYNSEPEDIEYFGDLTEDSYVDYSFDNSFTVFNSINDILYLIYSNKDKSIISYDIINNIRLNEIKNAHNGLITNFRHYLDKMKKRDLILSLSTMDNNIKMWNVNNFECLTNIKNIHKDFWTFSACFLKDDNHICIVTSNGNLDDCELIKVFDEKGNKIKEIKESNDDTFFIDSYYDGKTNKNYIITGNKGYVKSYIYNKNKIYNIYDDNDNKDHHSVIINTKEIITKLIESSMDGNIRIWNFNSAELLNKIKVCNNYLNGICLWNNEYLFVGCNDKTIKLIELKKGIIIKELLEHSDRVSTVKKIIHPIYGECLVSQGKYNDQIKLWTHIS